MILEILNSIATESSKNKKKEILKSHQENDLLKKVLLMAASPNLVYYIKKIPPYKSLGEKSLEESLVNISEISMRNVSGNEAIELLATTLSNVSEEDAKVIEKIIQKDLKIGMSASSINESLGEKLIRDTPYMGAVSYSAKKVNNLFETHPYLISEEKIDGRYANIKVFRDRVSVESRQGKENYFGNIFDSFKAIREEFHSDVVLNGEFIIDGLDRYTSNGIISSLVSIGNKKLEEKDTSKDELKFERKTGMAYQEAIERIVFVCWDYIPYSCYLKEEYDLARERRLKEIEDTLNRLKISNIRLVPYKIVKTQSEAMAHFKSIIEKGGEGTILKTPTGIWKDGKPVYQIKFKLEMEVDLEIVDFIYGTKGTKNEDVISTLVTKSSCGKLNTNPSNMNEEMMKEVTDNMDALRGTIVTVRCSGLSQDRDGNHSLLHPSIVKFRDDKQIADTLEEVIENENMIKTL